MTNKLIVRKIMMIRARIVIYDRDHIMMGMNES